MTSGRAALGRGAGSPGTRADRRAEMVLRIRDALERLLADGTAYTELGVDRIVAEAGIPRSTFYVYFSDRSEMLRAIFHESWASLGAATRPWWELEGPVARADVHRVLDGLVRSYRPPRAERRARRRRGVVGRRAPDRARRRAAGRVTGRLEELREGPQRAAHATAGAGTGAGRSGSTGSSAACSSRSWSRIARRV